MDLESNKQTLKNITEGRLLKIIEKEGTLKDKGNTRRESIVE